MRCRSPADISGAGLGVIELTVALHYVFDTPRDRLIWDVGHQAYPHKILTGRRDRIRTLRQGGGLSGFTKRAESEYDPFGAAHASTSVSAGLGMAVARDLDAKSHNVICVIGDGAMSAGMAYEAMNNAGAMDSRLIVILNDNDMSIAPPVGAMSAYLARLVSSRDLSVDPQGRRETRQSGCRRSSSAAWPTSRSMPAASDRRNLVRGARLLLRRPGRRTQSRPFAAGSEERARGSQWPVSGPCRDPEGQGLRSGGSLRRQVSWRGEVRRRHRRTGRKEHRICPPTPRCSAKASSRKRARTVGSSPSTRPCRPAPASTCSPRSFRPAPSTSASPNSTP